MITSSGPRRQSEFPAVDSPTRRRLPILLRHAWYGLNQAFRRRLAHLGLTPDQFTVMRTLLEAGAITQRQLTVLMGSDPNTVASLLERMEQAGMLKRRPHEKDGRANQLQLRAAGRRKYERARDVAVSLQLEVLGVLPEPSREVFLEQLALVADASRVAAGNSPKRGS